MKRGAYRQDFRAELDALMARRARGGVSLEALADRAGISRRTFLRIRSSGRAFRRHVVALKAALGALEREAKGLATMFPGEADGD